MAETMRATVASLLKGIDRYNPENLSVLEKYVNIQVQENTYDLEANLAVLKLYQFNPSYYQTSVAVQILLKALTNLPYTDLNLCKSLLDGARMDDENVVKVLELSEMLETCQFSLFWATLSEEEDLVAEVSGFKDSIRKFICHVIGISFQSIDKSTLSEQMGGLTGAGLESWVTKYGWVSKGEDIFIANQEENVKTKKITEKIAFESIVDIMGSNAA